jgi:hypothetical protein
MKTPIIKHSLRYPAVIVILSDASPSVQNKPVKDCLIHLYGFWCFVTEFTMLDGIKFVVRHQLAHHVVVTDYHVEHPSNSFNDMNRNLQVLQFQVWK